MFIRDCEYLLENLFFISDCHSKSMAEERKVRFKIVKESEKKESITNFAYRNSSGLFNMEGIAAKAASITGIRLDFQGKAMPGCWYTTCAGYTILVFSQTGDLIIDLAEKLGHGTRAGNITRVGTIEDDALYAKLIVDAIKEYRDSLTFDNTLDLDDIIL